jgi:formate dehydrogenase major subunit
MTNHWLDLQNAKVFLIQGSNAAENHVMSMKWVRKAQERGAIIIHVDPRYNRTSAAADIYARIRAGSDIAFLNAIINYILENKLYDEPYVKLHTNALMLTDDEFGFEDGLFTGFDEAGHKYDTKTWGYDLDETTKKPKKAASLDDPRCAFAKLKTFFSRYSLDQAAAISGVPADQIRKIAETFATNRPGTIMYALGMTQHTVAVQNIRSYGILQLLLGNIGKPGGGVNALRGEPNVQGACDMGVLNNYLPGYLNYPTGAEPTLKDWTKNNGTFRAKFITNTLKSWFGDNATAANDYGYQWLPKKGKKDYSILGMMESAHRNELKLLYVVGQNPMVTNPNLNVTWEALGNLDMLVVQDLWETETAAFWHRPGVDPKDIKTEVVVLPAAYFMEKDGTITGSGRLVQWRNKAVEPPGQAKNDLDIFDELYRRVRDLYRSSTEEKDQIFKRAVWSYPAKDKYEAVLQEIGGFDLKTGKHVNGIADLQTDGTTASGSWIYAGVYKGGKNLTRRRDSKTDPSGLGIYPNFAWTWPGNMHILYNRASCDENGVPFDKEHAIVWWDAEKQKWSGVDTPDVPVPTDGPSTPNGQRAFRMNGEGVGRLFAAVYKDPDPKSTEGLPRDGSYTPKDGPLPEFYEPVESPTLNAMHPNVQINPILKYPRVKSMQPIGTVADYPYVLMTSSMAEHWCAGSTTRNVPWLNELVPEPVVELPEKLAGQLGIADGDLTRVWSARGEVTVKAVVTRRMQPQLINGKEVFTVWMPYNWGFKGLSTGPSTNLLTIDAVDPNAGTQETKACLVNLVRAEGKGGNRV